MMMKMSSCQKKFDGHAYADVDVDVDDDEDDDFVVEGVVQVDLLCS